MQTIFPNLNIAVGELYAGIIFGKDGAPSHHLIILPGEAESVKWSDAVEWAKSIGGELPTLRELGMARVNAAEHFQRDWYWSGEQPASNSDYAWCQHFGYGDQTCYDKYNELRARAVRRLIIE